MLAYYSNMRTFSVNATRQHNQLIFLRFIFPLFHIFPNLFVKRCKQYMINRQSSNTPTPFTRLRIRKSGSTVLKIGSYENFTTFSTPENSFSSEHNNLCIIGKLYQNFINRQPAFCTISPITYKK